jgi:hypothetical protein
MNQILLGPKVSLCRLNRCVAQQHLNLLKLAATGAAQLRAHAAEIVRRDARNARCFGVGLDELLDHLLR